MTRIDALPGANQRTPLWRARLRNDLPGYIFMLPTLAALVAFTLYPLVDTAWLSLTNSNGATGSFIGLANYVTIFTDNDFWMALWNTVYMGVLTLVIGVPLSLVVATLINVVGRTSSVYKALYFSPNVTSAIATAITFSYLLYPTSDGWVNSALGLVGIHPVQWLSDPATARFAIVILSVWHGLGYTTLIWLAGLQTIPGEIYEAAMTDGATAFQRWRYITIPGLRPVTFFIIVVQTIAMFQQFAEVYQIGGSDGQPGGVLTTLMVYIYRVGFNAFDFGQASAATMALFAIIMLATLLNFALSRRRA
jgi:ABC-type sugar transport system permease subunit